MRAGHFKTALDADKTTGHGRWPGFFFSFFRFQRGDAHVIKVQFKGFPAVITNFGYRTALHAHRKFTAGLFHRNALHAALALLAV